MTGRSPHHRDAALSRRRRLGAVIGAAFVLASLLVGCGGDDRATRGAADSGTPQLPWPPQAQEPAADRGGERTPAGEVLRIGGRPEGVAVEPRSGTVGVALRGREQRFLLLEAANMRPRGSLPLPGTSRHAAAGAGRFVVPIEDARRTALIDPRGGGRVQLAPSGDGPHAAAVAGDQIVVADELGGTVTLLRGTRRLATLPVDVQPGGAADAGDGQVAIVSVRANTVALLDLRTRTLGPSQNAGYGPSHVVAGDDGRLYIADTRGGAILVFATRPRLKALQRVPAGRSPYGLAIDPARNRLWVTDTDAGELLEFAIDAERPTRVRSYAAVRQPNTIAVDPASGDVFVAGAAAGELQRVTQAR